MTISTYDIGRTFTDQAHELDALDRTVSELRYTLDELSGDQDTLKQRVSILETDGMANQSTQQSFTNAGAYNSYYNILPGDTVNTSDVSPGTDAVNVATRRTPPTPPAASVWPPLPPSTPRFAMAS